MVEIPSGDELLFDSQLIQEANSTSVSPLLIFLNQSVAFEPDKVKDLVTKLKLYEKVSLVFFLQNNAELALQHLRKMLGDNHYDPISSWYSMNTEIPNSKNECSSMLLEGLVMIQNFYILTDRCYKFDALNMFRPNDMSTFFHINPVKKVLYKIAEALTFDEAKKLVQSIEDEVHLLHQRNWPEINVVSNYLEIYFLVMISEKCIDLYNMSSLKLIVSKMKLINHEFALLVESKISKNWVSNTPSGEVSRVSTLPSDEKPVVKNKCLSAPYEIIDKNNVGLCIIINQQKFKKDFSEREGSEVDCEALGKTFKSLQFKVEVLVNLDKSEIFTSIVKEVNDKFKREYHSVFVLVILSHGIRGHVYGVDGEAEAIDNIKNSMSDNHCPSLHGKPKVLIIQACQGDKFYESSQLHTDGISPNDVKRGVSDLLVCVATIPGFKAFRHKKNGSWYIQALCDLLNKYPEENIYKILTYVNCELEKFIVAIQGKKVSMLSEFNSCLSKMLYFKINQSTFA